MSNQQLFDILFSVISVLGGGLMSALWQEVKSLQKTDKELIDRISRVELLVAGVYVKKDELSKLSDAIFAKLDRIEDKLDGKVDK